ncbi:hypothetical protein [Edaphobacter sp.]|uniref:hypothetical protein n=1 Tax=Edaphobacter sp. TaxID=1934404 RepID=UPI002DB88173|nr:hypothetical protein [Edaphobacter sp.]HEU5340153.1 hypothetical protein [Edaphobacter sp.]
MDESERQAVKASIRAQLEHSKDEKRNSQLLAVLEEDDSPNLAATRLLIEEQLHDLQARHRDARMRLHDLQVKRLELQIEDRKLTGPCNVYPRRRFRRR